MYEIHLTQKELARRLGVSHRTLERWRWHGTGPIYLKIGNRIRYRLRDVEAFEQKSLMISPSQSVYATKPDRLAKVMV